MFGPTGICTFAEFVERMIRVHRGWDPTDPRSDRELAEEILELAWQFKIIGKAPDGSFLVPHLVGAKSFNSAEVLGALQPHKTVNSSIASYCARAGRLRVLLSVHPLRPRAGVDRGDLAL